MINEIEKALMKRIFELEQENAKLKEENDNFKDILSEYEGLYDE